MKEKIGSYDLPKTEMKKVHGSTRIVLTNSASGHILKDVESENTFQSGVLAGLFDNIPFLNQNNNRSWETMVGGLLLFKNAIQVGSRFMPAGNTMVGNGSRGVTNSSTPLELGSFNSIDSYARFQNGVPTIYQVWDFNNNQANDTISCVSLTSSLGGHLGYGNSSGEYKSLEASLRDFSQDNTAWTETFDDTDTSYSFYVNSNGSVTVTETKRVGVQGSAFSGMSGSYTLTPATSFSGGIVEGSVVAYNCGNNKLRFVPQGGRTYTSGATVQYYEFDTTDKTIEIKTFTNSYTGSIFTKTREIYQYFYCTFRFTLTGKVICMSSNWTDLVVFDLSDSSYNVISKGGYTFIQSGGGFDAGEIGEDLYVVHRMRQDNTTYGWEYVIADLVNGTVYPINSYITAGRLSVSANTVNSNGLAQATLWTDDVMNSQYYFYNPLYLATINNLATPVVKDATMTMRVMYTLEEA